jgi:hypothetical protein
MQESVDDEMGEMFGKSNPQRLAFAGERAVSERNVPDQARDGRSPRVLGKAEDIGRLVDPPPGAVEDALMGVVGQEDGNLCGPAKLRSRLSQRLPNRRVGDRLEPVGPLPGLDREGNLQRRRGRAQRVLSSLALAPS